MGHYVDRIWGSYFDRKLMSVFGCIVFKLILAFDNSEALKPLHRGSNMQIQVYVPYFKTFCEMKQYWISQSLKIISKSNPISLQFKNSIHQAATPASTKLDYSWIYAFKPLLNNALYLSAYLFPYLWGKTCKAWDWHSMQDISQAVISCWLWLAFIPHIVLLYKWPTATLCTVKISPLVRCIWMKGKRAIDCLNAYVCVLQHLYDRCLQQEPYSLMSWQLWSRCHLASNLGYLVLCIFGRGRVPNRVMRVVCLVNL